MADSSSAAAHPQHSDDDVLELSRGLEIMIDNVEKMSMQLTWMAYDMVALRTSSKLGAPVWRLEEAYQRCRAAVCGDREQQPEMDERPDRTATKPQEM